MTTDSPPAGPQPTTPPDPNTILRSRGYVAILLFSAVVGLLVAVVAYFFLKWIEEAQQFAFTTLPKDLGFSSEPSWWPIPVLTIAGILVGLTIHYFHGTSGHEPAQGFKASGAVHPIDLPGIILASFATLSLGVVLGPEAPLIAIGSGLGVLAMHYLKRDAPAQAVMLIGAAGSFAAISTLLGSPIAGAFLLMEAAGVGAAMTGVVLVPGLLAAGMGTLIFVGLDNLTGFGTFSLAVPNLPSFTTPTGAEILWAIGIGLAATVVGTAIRRLALLLQPFVARRRILLTPVAGFAVGVLAVLFAATTDKGASEVLFSGQSAVPSLIDNAATWTVGALVLLMICKGLAYAASLSAFRGGPTFPGMFIGAAGGIALSHLPGLPMIAGVAMGIGAMTVVMLGLPLTSVLLTALFLQSDGLTLLPLIIVAVVVAYVASNRLEPEPAAAAPGASGGAIT
jgi:chloride channel protein, CIC family